MDRAGVQFGPGPRRLIRLVRLVLLALQYLREELHFPSGIRALDRYRCWGEHTSGSKGLPREAVFGSDIGNIYARVFLSARFPSCLETLNHSRKNFKISAPWS